MTDIAPPTQTRNKRDFDGMNEFQLRIWQFANSAHWEEGHAGGDDSIWADYTGRSIVISADMRDMKQTAAWVEFREYKLAADGQVIECPRADRLWGGSGKVWFSRPPMAVERDGVGGPWEGCRSAVQPTDEAHALHDADDLMSVMLRITTTGTDH